MSAIVPTHGPGDEPGDVPAGPAAPAVTPAPPGDRAARGTASRRALVVAGISAIIGLLIAGFGLFTAQGTRVGGVPAEDAAVVNGVPILMVDLVAQLRTLYDKSLSEATRAERTRALEDMIREELYVQRGVELGMANDDIDVRAALARATDSQVAADAMAKVPSDRDLRAWFDAHRAAYAVDGTLDVADYVVPPAMAPRAAMIAGALRGGSAPATLGLRETGAFADGPQYFAVARQRLGDALFAQASRLPVGGVSTPVAKADGTHIVRLRHRGAPVPETFDDARPKVVEHWLDDRIARLGRENALRLRRQADVKIAETLR